MRRFKGTWFHDVLGVWTIVWSYGPIVAATAVFARWPSISTFAFAFIVTAFRQNAIFVVAHECFHGTLFRNRRLNGWVGAYVAAAPIVLPYAQSRRIHLEHHRKVGQAADPSRYAWDWPIQRRTEWLTHSLLTLTSIPFLVRALRTITPKQSSSIAQTNDRPGIEHRGETKNDLSRIAFVHLLIVGLYSVTIGPFWYLALWLLPAIGPHILLDDLRQFLEHRHGRLVVYRAGPLERFLFGPFNFHLHAFHHIFASEPWFCVPSIEAKARAKRPDILTLGSYSAEVVRYLRGRDLDVSPDRSVTRVEPMSSDGAEDACSTNVPSSR